MFDWDTVCSRLRAYPPHFHQILSPCPVERIEAVENELGKLPPALREMLRRFNGAELYRSPNPFVTIFGISTTPPLPPLEWAPEWCIDTFTRKWRAAGTNRQNDWAIAMTNYGGLILLDGNESIKEWDTSQSIWLSRNLAVGEWMEKVIDEGEIVIAETG
jgi:hypothetical protein